MPADIPGDKTPKRNEIHQDTAPEIIRLANRPGAPRRPSPQDVLAAVRRTVATSTELRERLYPAVSAAGAISGKIRRLPEGSAREEEMLELIPDGYFVTDTAGIIQNANRAAVLLLSLPLSQLIGKPLINFIALEDRYALRRVLLAAKATEETIHYSEFVRMTPRRREPFDASLRVTAIRDSQTQAVTGARWLLHDLTERSNAEAERYRILLDAVEDYAILLLDENQQVIGWNRGAEVIFSYSETEAHRLFYKELFPPDQQHMAEVETAAADATGSYREEGWMMRKNGERFFGQGVLLALPTMRTRSAGYAKIVRDRTASQRQEEALRLNKARLQLALQAAGAGTWDWDLRTNTVTWSDEYWNLLGLDRAHHVPSYDSWKNSIPPEEQAQAVRLVQEAIETGDDLVNEHSVVTPPGTPKRWLLSLGKALQDDEGKPYRITGIMMDVTERKRVEQELADYRKNLKERVRERTTELLAANTQLQAEIAERERVEQARQKLAKQLVRAQEDERQRISRELHDHVGQHLTAFALGLRVLESASPADANIREHLNHLRQMTDTLGADLHRLAVELRPTALSDLGVIRALRGYIDMWMERTGIKADFEVSGVAENERLPAELETALYRIAQESLNNAAKYSSASHVSVVLTRQTAQVMLIVEDNGRGFDSITVDAASGEPQVRPRLGLAGMRERAELLEGSFAIESEPGSGTTIFVRLPLRSAAE